MGYYGDYLSPSEAVAAALHGLPVLDVARVSSECTWAAIEPVSDHAGFILLVLLRRVGGVWLYKRIPEQDAPFYYSCPEMLFARVPTPPSELAASWREDCRRIQATDRASGRGYR